MTVLQDNGVLTDHAVGIVASSRHQASSYAPWAVHAPPLDFESAAGKAQIEKYMEANLGVGSSRWARTYLAFWASEQWTGHTALIQRKAGKIVWCQGWVPVPGWLNYAKAFFLGGSVPGQWQDDTPMLVDPTCVSLEVPCDASMGDALRTYWDQHKSGTANYAFETTPNSCNCVTNAASIMRGFLAGQHRPEAAYFDNITSPLQGRLMRQILGGSLMTQTP